MYNLGVRWYSVFVIAVQCGACPSLFSKGGASLMIWWCNFYIPLTARVVEFYVLRNVLIM